MFKIISCVNNQFGIGYKNDLLYRIKDDLKFFKEKTINNVVIMGYKTFESLGFKPLPNRINIVLSSKDGSEHENVIFVHSINEVIDVCEKNYIDKEWFVIGGGSIYKQFIELNLVGDMFLTIVNDLKECDTYFPNFNSYDWVSDEIYYGQFIDNDNIKKTFTIEHFRKNTQ